MAAHVPYMSFLRPLALPRPSTVQRFMRFSTSSVQHEEVIEAKEDRNLVASRTADPSYPPASMKSDPRPKISRASQRTAHPTKDRPYPTRQRLHHNPTVKTFIPGPVELLEENLCAPNLPYYVNRTKTNELPVYNMKKRAGSMLLTQIRKIDGKIETLRSELQAEFGLKNSEVNINPITQHIIMKGHHREAVKMYLWQRNF